MLHTLIKFGFNFVLFSICSIALYNLFLVTKYFRQIRFAWHVNGFFLPCLPFVGTSYAALFEGRRVNVLGMVAWLKRNFGMPFNFWFGDKYHYFTDNAKEARIILNHPKCFSKAQMYDSFQYAFERSFFLLPAQEWKPRRHYFRTAFKSNVIKSFSSTFYGQSCILIDKIKSMSPNEDLYHFFSNYSFLNFVVTMAGLDGCEIDPAIGEIGSLLDRAQHELVQFVLNPIIPFFVWKWTSSGAKYKDLCDKMFKLLKELLQKKLKLRAKISEYIENSQGSVLIDLLLNDVADEEIQRDVLVEFSVFGAGATDTTGHSMAFCFAMLGMYPEQQQQVYEEVVSVVSDGAIDYAHVQDLKYTEAFICEVLRILPPVPFFGRYCDQDINFGTKILPQGSNVVVSAFHIHRNPLYWPDPLNFDPSRFFSENASNIVPGSYLPFSVGPRNCIGRDMAMAFLKINVASIVREFRITSNHRHINEFAFESCLTMKTTKPLDCAFHQRMSD